jgi:hypothetical protein
MRAALEGALRPAMPRASLMPVSSERSKRVVTVRAIRGADPGAHVDDWAAATPEQRMNAVWELTRLCLLWTSNV